jgi:serine-type D-Ala-D-Ala carboxypeptidase/endopeptidase
MKSSLSRSLTRLLVSVALASAFSPLTVTAQAPPNDARIKEILARRIDVERQAVGMAAIIVEGDTVRIVTHGGMSTSKADSITPDTLFEIGSITKTFTALLLADMVIKGEVKLYDSAEKWLPQGLRGLKLRDRTGSPIRLVDLATHRSGLPRLPDNMPNGTRADPYVDYREAELLAYLKSREVMMDADGGKTSKKRDEAYAYSNLGFGLLGYVLARAADTTYAELLQKRVLTPLGLSSTYLDVPRGEMGRFSNAHYIDNNGKPKQNSHWHFDVIAPAGALIMSARDMGRYAQAASGAIDTPLKAAFALAQKKYGDGMAPINPQGLAWALAPLNGRTVFSHNGMTGGFASSLWLDPERKSAAAVLSNTNVPVLNIALHLLEPSIPLKNLEAMRATAVAVDAKTLAQYVGPYRLQPNFDVTIRLRDNKLFAQATGQGEFELFGKSDSTFFARVTPLEIAFEDVKDGKAMRFQITQGGTTRTALRVE